MLPGILSTILARPAYVAAAAAAAGAIAMRAIAGVWIIPAAEDRVRLEVQAANSEAAARHVDQAAREARQIEREADNAPADELHCILNPRLCAGGVSRD